MTINYHQSYVMTINDRKSFIRINRETSTKDMFECLVTNEDGTKWELRIMSKNELKEIFCTKKREKLQIV